MTYYDLGSYGRKITTGSDDAQLWFDRGLIWLYAYNHEAAITCFRKALHADADCAMAYWGIAAASGPNYNQPWESMEREEREDAISTARTAIKAAQNAANGLLPVENRRMRCLGPTFLRLM